MPNGGLAARIRNAVREHARDPLYVNGYALVANAAASALLGFAFWMIAARRFDAASLGLGSALVSAATLAALLGKAGFDAALIRYGPSRGRAELRRLLALATACSVGLTLAVGLVMLALGVANLAGPVAIAAFFVLSLGTAAAWVLDALFISEQASLLVFLRNLVFNGVKLLVPLLLVDDALGVPLAWSVGLACSLAMALAVVAQVVRKHREEGDAPVSSRELATYAARNYALNLSEFVPGLALPLLVLAALGPVENARFTLAWTIATVAFLASKAIAQSGFASLVRAERPAAPIRKTLLLSALLLGPLMIVLLAGARPILGLFGRAYASDGAPLLELLALSIPGVVVANAFLAFLKARRPGWELTLLPAASLAVTLGLAPFALARGGLEGVGVLWLAVQLVVGSYAGLRLYAILRRRSVHEGTAQHRRAHEG